LLLLLLLLLTAPDKGQTLPNTILLLGLAVVVGVDQ
jgi:hypothetical protein